MPTRTGARDGTLGDQATPGDAPFEEGEEEESDGVTQVHSLEGATWRDMRIGQQSARELFGRVQPHHWPAMPAFSFGGLLGGGAAASVPEGGTGDEDGETPWWRALGSSSSGRQAWVMVAGVAAVLFIGVAIGSSGGGGGYDQEGDESPLSAGTPRHRADDDNGGGVFSRASPLRTRLKDVADTALAEGITMPMHTTFEVVRAGPLVRKEEEEEEEEEEGQAEGVSEGGMDFIVSVIAGDVLEAKAAIATPPSTAASKDPFDSRVLDSRMTVEELPPAHSLVLNKFNTMRNHALIITKEFQPQEVALTETDFSAWYRVVSELPAVGFYNSAAEAGASQRHKHMQVIPEDSIWDYRPKASEAIPVDEPIERLVGSSRDFSRVWRVPDFHFQHAFTLLPTPEELFAATPNLRGGAGDTVDDSTAMGVHLRARYVELLREIGFDTSAMPGAIQSNETEGNGAATPAGVPASSLPPYNALLTPRWLMVVPRSRREWGGLDVNGMGFLGALLVREKNFAGEGAGVDAVRRPGAFAVLEGVTFPFPSS